MIHLQKLFIVGLAVGCVALLNLAMDVGSAPLTQTRFETAQTADTQRSNTQRNNKSNGIDALINTGDAVSHTHIYQQISTQNIYETKASGMYFHLNDEHKANKHIPLAMVTSDFDVRVTGNIVRTRVSQRFKNDSENWEDATYVFPLPEDAALDAMLMQIGERKIKGTIQEKQAAQKAFQQAKNEGKSASLVSQVRPNMFTNNIANIAPKTDIVVSIEYQQTLRLNDARYELRIPSAIRPRYTPKNAQSNTDMATRTLLGAPEISVDILIDMGSEIGEIKSEHHAFKTLQSEGGTAARVSLDKQMRNEPSALTPGLLQDSSKDFVVHWQLAAKTKPRAVHYIENIDIENIDIETIGIENIDRENMSASPSGEQSKQPNIKAGEAYQYGLIQIVPPSQDMAQVQRDLTFILDTSGSMVGDAIEQAKAALVLGIDELSATDRFNIIQFNSMAKHLWPQSQVASESNKEKAKRYIAKLQASGGTEIADALSLAFDLADANDKASVKPSNKLTEKASEAIGQIIFITDGSVSNEAQLLGLIRSKLGTQRLFTIGIGSAPNTYFMSEAAIAGRGTYTLIGDISQVRSKMTTLLNKIKRPALSDIELIVNNIAPDDLKVFPSVIPDVYAGEPITLSYRIPAQHNNDKAVSFALKAKWFALDGTQKSRPMMWQSQLIAQNAADAKAGTKEARNDFGIAKQWAYQSILQLNRNLHNTAAEGEDYLAMQQFTKQAITELALKHQLVSEHTSLIAIDEQQHRPSKEYLAMMREKQKHIDTLSDKKWHVSAQQLPQTSTFSRLHLLVGGVLCIISALCFVLVFRR
ncbi:VIT domain-containing protein [Glaciecola siphonariae]|uniref:VIT domain-containing protein n=1 Tax=Glaciecola siphonariae TaxID=521012 RepID=A0ABV9M141_9ALTE